MDADTLRGYHVRLAEALEAWRGTDPEVLLTHYLGAGSHAKAAHYAVLAAGVADEALAFDRAARLYRLALDLRPLEDGEAGEIPSKLGDALANAGRSAEAADVYLQAAQDTASGKRLHLEQRAAEHYLRAGHVDQGVEVSTRVLRQVGMKLAASPTRALLSVVARHLLVRLRGTRYRERALSKIPRAALTRMDTCLAIAGALAMADLMRGQDMQLRYILLALKAGEPHHVAQALILAVIDSSLMGERARPRTQRIIRQLMELVERLNEPTVRGRALVGAGVAGKVEGQFKESADLLEEALTVLERCTGVMWDRQTARIFLFEDLMWMGRWDDLFRRLPGYMQDAQQRGDLYSKGYFQARSSALHWLARDEPQAALEETRRAVAAWSVKGFHLTHEYAFYLGHQALLYGGDAEAAWSSISKSWPALARSFLLFYQSVRVEIVHLRARTALAMAVAGHGSRYLSAAERDARKLAKERARWSAALANLIRAGVAATRGDSAAAVSHLAFAERGFEDVHMGMYAVAARRCRGTLLGGDEGARLTKAADAWMTAQQVKNPARMTALLAPGSWESPGQRAD